MNTLEAKRETLAKERIENKYKSHKDCTFIEVVTADKLQKFYDFISKQILYDDKEKVSATIVYSYDTQGHQNQIENYDSSGKRINRTVQKFDEAGNVIESILYDEADRETRKLYFTYDKYNNITRRKIVDIRPSPKTTVQTLRYEYDTHHNYIQETCLSGGNVIYAQKRVISYYD